PRLVDARPLPLPLAAVRAALRREPVTAARHRLGAVARAVARAAAERAVDVVHAEQAQAMPQALAAGRPVLLRAQNVESELWRGARTDSGAPGSAAAATAASAGARGVLRRREASRVARWEAGMVRRAALTLALTDRDAAT